MCQPAAGAASARSCRRPSPSRSAQAANAGVGPRQRRSADVVEDLRARPQRRQVLEEQRQVAPLAEHLGREVLDAAVLVHEPGGGDTADAGDARVAVGRVADEGEQVGDQRRVDAELLAHARPRCGSRSRGGRPARHGRRRRTGRGPCRASRCRPARRRRRPRRCARPRRARRRPRARPSATRPRPSPRAPPRAARTAARSAGSTPAPVLYPGQRSLRNDSITWSVATPTCVDPVSIICSTECSTPAAAPSRRSSRPAPRRRP